MSSYYEIEECVIIKICHHDVYLFLSVTLSLTTYSICLYILFYWCLVLRAFQEADVQFLAFFSCNFLVNEHFNSVLAQLNFFDRYQYSLLASRTFKLAPVMADCRQPNQLLFFSKNIQYNQFRINAIPGLGCSSTLKRHDNNNSVSLNLQPSYSSKSDLILL